jgi:hypothetical protein
MTSSPGPEGDHDLNLPDPREQQPSEFPLMEGELAAGGDRLLVPLVSMNSRMRSSVWKNLSFAGTLERLRNR